MNIRVTEYEQTVLPANALFHRHAAHLEIAVTQTRLLARLQYLLPACFQLADTHAAFDESRPEKGFVGISFYVEMRSQHFHFLPLTFDNKRLSVPVNHLE